MSRPFVSAIICTRNRGESILPTVRSILNNTYPDFEVIVIDQSTDERTCASLNGVSDDPRFRYIRSNTVGASRARNLGLKHARGEYVVSTDDDCVVPENWIDVLSEIFDSHALVALIFCNVVPGPHDASRGFVPAYVRDEDFIAKSIRDKNKARGIGAGMAMRKDAISNLGGFDEQLGPGTAFGDCEDGDLTVRCLLKGWHVYETQKVAVVHHGYRTWQEGKRLTARNWVGIGGAYIKPLKIGYWEMISVIFYEAVTIALWEPIKRLLTLHRPNGLKQPFYFCKGFLIGLGKPVDRNGILYKL